MMSGLAAWLVGVYLAAHACFAPEFIPRIIGSSIPIVALLAMLLPLVWLINSPNRMRFLQTGIGWIYIFLLVWWILSALIMSFKGYVPEIVQYGIRFHSAPIFFCGLLLTARRVRTAIFGYCIGFMIALLFCWKYGQIDQAGRFCILNTSLGNPNDLALNLLLGVGFMSILLINANILQRLIYVGATLVGLYFVLKTGSRANFLTLGVVFAVAWFVATARTRIVLLIGGAFALCLMLVVIPKSTWTRLTTISSASSEEIANDQYLANAIGSTEARKNLQLRAVRLTLQNPIFGVGPRMFVYALNDLMRTQDGFSKGTWQHPHNTYLDISAETGLVGLGLYVSCILWCLRVNYRAVKVTKQRRELQPVMAQSCCLLFASVVYAFGTLFCSIPYVGQLPFLLGVTAANWLALRDMGAFAPLRRPVAAAQRVAPGQRIPMGTPAANG